MKIIKSIVSFFYKVSGIKSVVNAVESSILRYRLRLNIVPMSYKLFICLVGVAIGGSGVYVSLEAPKLMAEYNTLGIRMNNTPIVQKAKADTIVEKEMDIVDLMFTLESSRGKYNYSKCEEIGKYNRYGFGVSGNGDYLCFEKDKDTVAVTGWVEQKKATGMSDGQLMCLYNTGIASQTCDYFKEALAIWREK